MRIGIVGAGFSGIAIAANLFKQAKTPMEIILFDKSGSFAKGPAYSTPYPFHLLNVRAEDMSAFDNDPGHFVRWLEQHEHDDTYSEPDLTLNKQFVPRQLYGNYLQEILSTLQQPHPFVTVHLESQEVIDVITDSNQPHILTANQQLFPVDKMILAIGNNPAAAFPFSVGDDIHCINNPWDYQAVQHIPCVDPVFIVGTGLSMIDAVLTLHHHQHRGPIYVLSRHGLLPLPHTHSAELFLLSHEQLSSHTRTVMTLLRKLSKQYVLQGGDWRAVIQAFRKHLPDLWKQANASERARFLRHVLPYWNIHRHRVHVRIAELLQQLQQSGQMQVFSGRVMVVENGRAQVKLRGTEQQHTIPCRWLINCMGPSQKMSVSPSQLVEHLIKKQLAKWDALGLGLEVDDNNALKMPTNNTSSYLYTVGAATKGATWEIGAVPEIRKQVSALVRELTTTHLARKNLCNHPSSH